MGEAVAFQIDGHDVLFELSADERSALAPATGADEAVAKAVRPFEDSLAVFSALARKFASTFEGQHVSSAEITMGLKVTAKGDFVIVGTSGEASLGLKLTIEPKGG
jgi:hypothetical protein